MKPKKKLTRCNGTWTTARFNSFITGALRAAHRRWGPRNVAKGKARVTRGVYKCAICNTQGPATLSPEAGKKRRRQNSVIDHIIPVVDPHIGKTTWDEYIERMFVEADGYQILCYKCNKKVTRAERKISDERRRKEKNNDK